MGFEFSWVMLFPAAVGAIGLWAALNREKLRRHNLRVEEHIGSSRMRRRSDDDPTGVYNSIGGALMFLGCLVGILLMGFGVINA